MTYIRTYMYTCVSHKYVYYSILVFNVQKSIYKDIQEVTRASGHCMWYTLVLAGVHAPGTWYRQSSIVQMHACRVT